MPKKQSKDLNDRAFTADNETVSASLKPKRRAIRFAWFPWAMTGLVLGGLALGYWLGEARPWVNKITYTGDLTPAEAVALPDGAQPLQPGPWGNMEFVPISIEPPEEYLPVRMIEQADRRWRFEGFTSEQLTALFQSADLTNAQRAELLDASKWQQDRGSIYLNPSKDLVLSLSPQARKQIYAPLTADPNNIFGLLRCSYPADHFDALFTQSGLPDETIALVKKLSYPHGHLVFFCDIPLVLDTLSRPEQKLRLLKTLLRKSTLLLRLHLTPDSNINALEHYWIRAGWGVDLRPMLESLTKLPQGARIDVVELLPPVPSANLYSYPFPSTKPEDQHKDCHWTALNFFRDVPDQRFTDSNVVHQTLITDYYPVLSDPRYGDLIILAKPNGDIIHSSVYIADNIVYTKNSSNFRDPFILMTMSDMIDNFSAQIPEDQSLQVLIYRNKYY